jgi:hypothetical protein
LPEDVQMGQNRILEGMMLLETGQPMWEPITQVMQTH